MYAELRISKTLHKKPYRIGPGLYGTSENATYPQYVEKPPAHWGGKTDEQIEGD